MSYIGARPAEIKDALRRGLMRFATRKAVTKGYIPLLDLIGGGTRRLTGKLARPLIARWWSSGPGTKIAVGYVRRESTGKNVIPKLSDIRIVTITRPRTTDAKKRYENYWGHTLDKPIHPNSRAAERVFSLVVTDAIEGARYDEIYTTYAFPGDTLRAVVHLGDFFDNVNNYGKNLSQLFVWPAGIIDNATFDHGINKLTYGLDRAGVQTRRANFEPRYTFTRNHWARYRGDPSLKDRYDSWRAPWDAKKIQNAWRRKVHHRRLVTAGVAMKRKGLDRNTTTEILKRIKRS